MLPAAEERLYGGTMVIHAELEKVRGIGKSGSFQVYYNHQEAWSLFKRQ